MSPKNAGKSRKNGNESHLFLSHAACKTPRRQFQGILPPREGKISSGQRSEPRAEPSAAPGAEGERGPALPGDAFEGFFVWFWVFFFVFVFGDTEIPRGDPAGIPQIRPLPSGPPHLAEPAAPLSSGGSARVSGAGVTGTSGAGHAGSCSSDIAVAQGAIPGTRRAEGMGMLIPGKRRIRRDLLDLHQSLTN